MSKHQWYEELQKKITIGTLIIDEPLCKYTMTKLGGAADLLVIPGTIDETEATVRYAYENNIPLLLLGNGSNMVVRDGGVRGIVLHLSQFNEIRIEGTLVHAEAGALIIDVSKRAAAEYIVGFRICLWNSGFYWWRDGNECRCIWRGNQRCNCAGYSANECRRAIRSLERTTRAWLSEKYYYQKRAILFYRPISNLYKGIKKSLMRK